MTPNMNLFSFPTPILFGPGVLSELPAYGAVWGFAVRWS